MSSVLQSSRRGRFNTATGGMKSPTKSPLSLSRRTSRISSYGRPVPHGKNTIWTKMGEGVNVISNTFDFGCLRHSTPFLNPACAFRFPAVSATMRLDLRLTICRSTKPESHAEAHLPSSHHPLPIGTPPPPRWTSHDSTIATQTSLEVPRQCLAAS